MPIVGFNFEKILAERKKPIDGPIKVSSDVNIKSVEEEKFKVGKSEGLLKFNFAVKIDYEKFGEVELAGHVLYMEEPKKMKEILDEWNKKKNIKQEIAREIVNMILFKTNVKALSLEQDINMPLHLRLPKVAPVKDTKEYIG